MPNAKDGAVRLDLYGHTTISALSAKAPADLLERDWKIGDTITLTVIGIQRREWEGTPVR